MSDDEDYYDESIKVNSKGHKITVGSVIYSTTGTHLPDKIASSVKEQFRKDGANNKITFKEKADRATVEQVLDPRTRLMLYKMINNGTINEINGCISTGKEANVYHAISNDEELAIKIYKTSILVFKDRDRYVSGEFRFRRGYSKHNPRKMVQVWAEKEIRNLTRLRNAGIPCPKPILLRKHILIMSLIGKKGKAAPRLKDSKLTEDDFVDAYFQIVQIMRKMYHHCKLIHADLSEYNILYFKKKLYIIDVSQSVEHDHPMALDFLRRDCVNITNYFKKNGVVTMSVRELFDFITDITLSDDDVDEYLDKVREILENKTDEQKEKDELDDKVFIQSYIPRTLLEIDLETAEAHRWDAFYGEDMDTKYYRKITGLNEKLTGASLKPDILKTEEEKQINDPLEVLYQDYMEEYGYDDYDSEEYDETDDSEEIDEDIDIDKVNQFINDNVIKYDNQEYQDIEKHDEVEVDVNTKDEVQSDEELNESEDESTGSNDIEESEESESESSDEVRVNQKEKKQNRRNFKRFEDKESKKERKNLAKFRKQEKRKIKIPKHIKKRSQKQRIKKK